MLREVVGSRELNKLNPEQEILTLAHSYSLFHETVLRTQAHLSCYKWGWLGRRYFDREAPVQLHAFSKNMVYPLRLKVTDYDATGFVVKGDDWEQRGVWGEPVVMPTGDSLLFVQGGAFSEQDNGTLYFKIEEPSQTAQRMMGKFRYAQLGKSGKEQGSDGNWYRTSRGRNVVRMRQAAEHPDKSARFLHTLLKTYEERHVAHFNRMLDSTKVLLDERLTATADELAMMEDREWGYKAERRAANLSEQGVRRTRDLMGLELRSDELETVSQQLAAALKEMRDS